MNNAERATKLLESLRDDLQGLKACVRGENRHSVVCMLEKLQEAIETLVLRESSYQTKVVD